MSDCKAYREEIEELAGVGRLGLEARAHVNACAPCRALEQERASLRRLVRELEKVEAPADFEFRLRARMAASRGGGGRNPFRPVYGFAAIAASALFLFVSASLYVTQERRQKLDAGRQEVLTAEGSAGGSKQQPLENTVAQATSTASAAGPTPSGLQGKQSKVKTRATSSPRAKEIALREPAGQANTKNYLTSAVTGAGIIEQGRTVRISLDTSAQPLRVVLKDERGASRVVPMRSVSFGSQELIAREGQRRGAPSADKEGVW
jgi:hypothetical protein